MHKIFIQYTVDKSLTPTAPTLRRFAKAALTETKKPSALTLRFVTQAEIHEANRDFRHKDKPTNVISFPSDDDIIEGGLTYVGDILLCPLILNEEANAQAKTQEAHYAHLIMHSVLHLLGHDHENESEAERMEAIEIRLLHQFGYDNPYIHPEDKTRHG